MEERYCQSCGMPMGATDEFYATEKDGTKSADYCQYCYKDGAFTDEGNMHDMIEHCIAPMVEHNPGMTEEAARSMMEQYMPTLKRWRQG